MSFFHAADTLVYFTLTLLKHVCLMSGYVEAPVKSLMASSKHSKLINLQNSPQFIIFNKSTKYFKSSNDNIYNPFLYIDTNMALIYCFPYDNNSASIIIYMTSNVLRASTVFVFPSHNLTPTFHTHVSYQNVDSI